MKLQDGILIGYDDQLYTDFGYGDSPIGENLSEKSKEEVKRKEEGR